MSSFTWREKLTGMVMWPRNRDPGVKGPKPRLITIEQARELERLAEESDGGVKNDSPNGDAQQDWDGGRRA